MKNNNILNNNNRISLVFATLATTSDFVAIAPPLATKFGINLSSTNMVSMFEGLN
jgi:hypothetical protein